MVYRVPHWMVAAVALSAVSGCANQPVTSATYRANDVRTFAQGVMVTGPLFLETRGAPYDEQNGRLERTVVAAMKEAITWSDDARLTTEPAEVTNPSMHVIWTFNNAWAIGTAGRQVSRSILGRWTAGKWPGKRCRTYCDGEDVLSNVGGRADEIQGLSDPAFATLVRQATAEMLRYGGNDRNGFRSGIIPSVEV